MTAHLAERDTRLVAVSRAPRTKLEATARRWADLSLVFVGRKRLQLRFPRLVSPRGGRRRRDPLPFAPTTTTMTDLPGISAFIREPDRANYRSYSAYARGLDMLNPAYQLLDITALGRQEDAAQSDGLVNCMTNTPVIPTVMGYDRRGPIGACRLM